MRTLSQIFPVDWDAVSKLGMRDDLAGWNSDHPLFDVLVNEAVAKTEESGVKEVEIVEIGSWKGRSAVHMAKALKEARGGKFRPGDRIYCLDTWQGGIDHLLSDLPQDEIPRELGYPFPLYRQFLWNCYREEVHEVIQPVVAPSAIGIGLLRAQGISPDLAYVDGAHDHDGAYSDLSGIYPLVAPGRVVFGDDVNMPGVQSAVSRFMDREGIAQIEIDVPFWVVRKPS